MFRVGMALAAFDLAALPRMIETAKHTGMLPEGVRH
jgi:hypothetical protein